MTQVSRLIGNSPDLSRYFDKQSYMSAWSNPESFARYIEGKKQSEAWEDSAWTHDKEWTGTKSMVEALEYAKGYWKEGAEMVSRLRNKILAFRPIVKRPATYGIVGVVPSIPRAVAGNPMNMKSPDDVYNKRRPIITLLSNFTASCGIAATIITNRAAVIAAIIDHIEAAGYSCEVISTAMTKHGFNYDEDYREEDSSFRAATVVTVKNSNQPVDIQRIAFGLGHASMFRRLVFADWQTEPSCKNGLGSCLGHVYTPSNETFHKNGMFVLPSVQNCSSHFRSEGVAMTKGLDYMIAELKAQGCPPFLDKKR